MERSGANGDIPFWIWVLAAFGLGGGTAILALLTSHLVELRGSAHSEQQQRRTLSAISAGLQQPILDTEAAFRAIFESPTPTFTPVNANSFDQLLAELPIRDLPPEVQTRLEQLRTDLATAVQQLGLCRDWHIQLAKTQQRCDDAHASIDASLALVRTAVTRFRENDLAEREQHRAHLAGAVTPHEIAAVLDELRAAPTDDRVVQRLGDALDETGLLLLRLRSERRKESLAKLTEQTRRALQLMRELIDRLGAERGADTIAVLRPGADQLREQLLGVDGQSGYPGAHRAWLVNVERGKQLREVVLGRLRRLASARFGLEQLLSERIIEANGALRKRLQNLWTLCLVVGGAVAILFLLLARMVSRRAHRQIHDLQQARRQAADAVRAQGLFLANMSHEIRTPMNGVLGMAEMLESGPLNDDQKQVARTIRSSAESLLTVINDILDISKIQAGKLELDTTDFDLRHTIEDTLDLLGHLAHQKGLELLCFIDHGVPRRIHGDSDRLRQVLLNLTGNAIKFTENGEITVLVDLLSEHREVVRLRVSISDTGVGISEEAQRKLFKPFTQADPTTTRRFGGTGLGLTISKRLIQMMGGEIAVRSKVGAGTTFTFTVSLTRGRSDSPVEDPTDFAGRSLLIVDDNEKNREILAMRVASWKMGFDLAADADQAMETLANARARGHHFDVALIDDQMPGLSGTELAAAIADHPDFAGTRCVLLRSAPLQAGEPTLNPKQIAAVLRKPVLEDRLRDCLTKVLGLAPGRAPSQTHEAQSEGAEGARILVAEDNAINQRVMRQLLRKAGCDVVFADNGVQAVERVEAEDFDLVLMDCQMPEMDGFDATRAIRQLTGAKGTIPVVALTANVLPADRRACTEAGMDDFLSKPIKQEQLREAIAKWRKPADVQAGAE
ncbi:MAG: response regulator [Planctomycetota bacterium]